MQMIFLKVGQILWGGPYVAVKVSIHLKGFEPNKESYMVCALTTEEWDQINTRRKAAEKVTNMWKLGTLFSKSRVKEKNVKEIRKYFGMNKNKNLAWRDGS